MKKWRQIKSKGVVEEYQPISLAYFLNMELAGGGGGKEVITQNLSLSSVKDVYLFYSVPGNIHTVRNGKNQLLLAKKNSSEKNNNPAP